MKVALYVRVSTIGHGQSVDVQLNDLRRFAAQRGFEIVKEYADEGISGSKSSRPALDQMLADAKRGKFQAILVFRLDRLGRSLAHLVRLLEDFRSWGVELVSFSEGLDFSSTTGKLMYQIISAFSEFERDVIRERVHAGLRTARAKGRKPGRPCPDVSAEQLREALAGGDSYAEVSGKLGISPSTISRRLRAAAA